MSIKKVRISLLLSVLFYEDTKTLETLFSLFTAESEKEFLGGGKMGGRV